MRIVKRNRVQRRVALVLKRLTQLCDESKLNAAVISDELDTFIGTLSDDDFFGIEGELDPRGDFRDDRFSMSYVQGIDA